MVPCMLCGQTWKRLNKLQERISDPGNIFATNFNCFMLKASTSIFFRLIILTDWQVSKFQLFVYVQCAWSKAFLRSKSRCVDNKQVQTVYVLPWDLPSPIWRAHDQDTQGACRHCDGIHLPVHLSTAVHCLTILLVIYFILLDFSQFCCLHLCQIFHPPRFLAILLSPNSLTLNSTYPSLPCMSYILSILNSLKHRQNASYISST